MELKALCLGICLVALPLTTQGMQKTHYVKDVRQNFVEKMNSAVTQQVYIYNTNAYFYRAYASYFQRTDVALPGFQKFFLERSSKIEEQAWRMTTILNQRGGHVTFQNINLRTLCTSLSKDLEVIATRFPHTCFFVLDDTRSSGKKYPLHQPHHNAHRRMFTGFSGGNSTSDTRPTALDALEDALALERQTNDGLLSFMNLCIATQDPAMRRKLDDELAIQVDIIQRLAHLVTRLRTYKDTDNYDLGEYILDSETTYE